MTPLPKKKMSRTRSLKHKAQQKVETLNLVSCGQCKKMILPHHLCPYCGSYKGKTVMSNKSRAKTKVIKEEKANRD